MDSSPDMDTCSVAHHDGDPCTNKRSTSSPTPRAYTEPNADEYPGLYGDSYSESCPYEYSDTVTNTVASADSDSCACSYANTHAAPDEHAYCDTVANPNAASHKYVNSDSVDNSDCNVSNSDSHSFSTVPGCGSSHIRGVDAQLQKRSRLSFQPELTV